MANEEAVPQVDGGQQDNPLEGTEPQNSGTPDYQAQLAERDAEIAKLAKTLASNPGNYGETMVFQFYEEGPALKLHNVTIEGPLKVIQTPEQISQQTRTKEFLGKLAEPDAIDKASLNKDLEEFFQRYLSKLFRRPATEQDILHLKHISSKEA